MDEVTINITEIPEVVIINVIEAESDVTINITEGESGIFTSGVKTTGIDAGVLGTISITDDYIYVCVTGGVAGVAIWKKSLLFQSI